MCGCVLGIYVAVTASMQKFVDYVPSTKHQLAKGVCTISGYKLDKLGARGFVTQGQVVIDRGGLLNIVNWELRTKFTIILQLFANSTTDLIKNRGI